MFFAYVMMQHNELTEQISVIIHFFSWKENHFQNIVKTFIQSK